MAFTILQPFLGFLSISEILSLLPSIDTSGLRVLQIPNMGKFYDIHITLGVLPKIPFKLTQSIHVALQKNCYFDQKLLKLFIFEH